MKFHRPRFTVRRLMLVVAIIGLMIAGLELKRRRESYLDVRNKHELQVSRWTKVESYGEWMLSGYPEESPQGQKCIDYIRMARDLHDYHEKQADKYNQAALHPWISVGPDLPAPPEPIALPRL
jgi:hypothetical protein